MPSYRSDRRLKWAWNSRYLGSLSWITSLEICNESIWTVFCTRWWHKTDKSYQKTKEKF